MNAHATRHPLRSLLVSLLVTALCASASGCKEDSDDAQTEDKAQRPVSTLFAQGPIAMPTPAQTLTFGMTRKEAAEAWPAATGGELKLKDYGRNVALEPMFGGMGAVHEFLRKVYLTVPAEEGLETAVANWGEPEIVTWQPPAPPPPAADDDVDDDDSDDEDDTADEPTTDDTAEKPQPGVEYRYWFDEGSGLRVLARPRRGDDEMLVFVFSPFQSLEAFVGKGRGSALGFEETPLVGQNYEALKGTWGQRFGDGSYRGKPWGRLHLPPVGYAESEVIIDMQVVGDEIVSYHTALQYPDAAHRDQIFDAFRKRFGNPTPRADGRIKRYRSSPVLELADDPTENRVKIAVGKELP